MREAKLGSSSSTTPSRTAASSASRTRSRRRAPPPRARPSAARARRLEKDVDRLGRQPGQAAAEQLVQALRHPQRLARLPVACRCEQARDRARARRTGCPPSPPARGRARAGSTPGRAAPSADGAAPQAQRAEEAVGAVDHPGTSARARTERQASGARRNVARKPTCSSRNRRSAICSTAADDASSHCRSSSGDDASGPARPAP